MWTCPSCGENIEDQFDGCWRCAAPERSAVEPEDAVTDVEKTLLSLEPCIRCGSRRVVPNARLGDQGQYSDGKTRVLVAANPTGWFLKGIERAEVVANLCCDCGHLEFRATGNLDAMWTAYAESVRGSKS